MKNPLKVSSAGEQNPAPLFAALVLVALVPVAGVLWFMTVAMRNERLAVEARLTEVYTNHIASLQRQVTAWAKEREAALAAAEGRTPAEKFAAIVRAGVADSAVVFDAAGKPRYPTLANAESGGPGSAAPATTERARALQAEAAKLLSGAQKEAALARLVELAGDASLRDAVSAQGALIVPNAQLLILKLGGPGAPRAANDSGATERAAHPILADLVTRLNDYADAALSSGQRRFLMEELSAINPDLQARFPTLVAEKLASEYLEQNTSPVVAGVADPGPASSRSTGSGQARPATLQRSSLAGVWRLPSADRTVLALFREDRLRAELEKFLAPLVLPDAHVTVLAPSAALAARPPALSLELGEMLPGWRLALGFRGGDPLAEASARQTRFYLWTGVGVVAIIAIVALLVARYVAAQMRLTRLKNELVSTVSHELRTPLASMRALVDTLSSGRYRDEAQLQEYLQLIGKENVRLSQLIENFLTFSRLERGQHQFRFTTLAPETVVAATVAALREKLAAARCRFEMHVAPDLPSIRADGDALATVLINLLDNACKYTGDDKRIGVQVYTEAGNGTDREHSTPEDWPQKAREAQKQNGSVLSLMSLLRPSPASSGIAGLVVFEISDNGIGLAAGDTKKIFDRFYQVDQSLTRQRGGCGLGLSIVQSIVRAHGGTVEVESELGKGSTFRVKIPTTSAPRTEATAPVSFDLKPVDRGLRG